MTKANIAMAKSAPAIGTQAKIQPRTIQPMGTTIAAAVIAAAKQIQMTVPLVVRLEGTNVDLGKSMLNDSGLAIVSADDLNDAAQKIVKAIGA